MALLYLLDASDFQGLHLTSCEMLQKLKDLLLALQTITSLLKIEHFLAVAEIIECLGFFKAEQSLSQRVCNEQSNTSPWCLRKAGVLDW